MTSFQITKFQKEKKKSKPGYADRNVHSVILLFRITDLTQFNISLMKYLQYLQKYTYWVPFFCAIYHHSKYFLSTKCNHWMQCWSFFLHKIIKC